MISSELKESVSGENEKNLWDGYVKSWRSKSLPVGNTIQVIASLLNHYCCFLVTHKAYSLMRELVVVMPVSSLTKRIGRR